MAQSISLSLQFGRFAESASHRAALSRHAVTRAIRHALQANVVAAEITVRIVDAAEGQALNASYRHKNYATNVLTFDYTQAPMLTADVVLCAPVVAKEALEQGKTLAAHYIHLLVHGVLHAQGFDHETSDADAAAMEALEVMTLAQLGLPSPY